MLLKEEKSGHEKEILKETQESRGNHGKERSAERMAERLFEGLTGKDFTAAGLFSFSLLFCRLFVLQYGVFGSSIDWISQHSTPCRLLPKAVLRDRKPLPGFRMESGRRSEYLPFCLLRSAESDRAVILPFPVHPDGPVGDGFLRAAVCGGCSAFYRWISKKGLHYGNCLLHPLFFTCSTALLYHSYNQLMFVNYMPFLLLALLGVDRHFQKKKRVF